MATGEALQLPLQPLPLLQLNPTAAAAVAVVATMVAVAEGVAVAEAVVSPQVICGVIANLFL